MALTQLILVRHGQSEGNVAAEQAQREHLDRIDVPARDPDVVLSETGQRQADAVGRWLTDLSEDERAADLVGDQRVAIGASKPLRRQLAERLRCVHVQASTGPSQPLGDFYDGLYDAGLVIGCGQRNDRAAVSALYSRANPITTVVMTITRTMPASNHSCVSPDASAAIASSGCE